MTSPDHEVVEREMHIAARPEIVFSFFTDPEKMVRFASVSCLSRMGRSFTLPHGAIVLERIA